MVKVSPVWGRISRGEPVPLAPLVEECVAVVRPLRRPGVELVQKVPPGETLETDREHLRRIVANLLSNAVKYTEAGSITVSVRPDGEWVEIAVADTGIGIPETALSYIFDEFRQVERGSAVRREGSGLGLAIVRRATALLGGQVTATSQVGRGSLFTVRLPRRLPEPAAATETPAPAPPGS